MIGTVDNTPIGIELAYRMAGAVLDVVRNYPGRPILLLVDTQGQRLSHRDELPVSYTHLTLPTNREV